MDELDDLGILTTTPRRDLLALVPARLADYERYLGARWPGYREAAAVIQSRGLSIEAASLRKLRRLHLKAPEGFPQLNRKTWSAWAGAHSKSREASQPEGAEITTDDTVRARVNAGLQIRSVDGGILNLDALQRTLKEVAFPDRCISENWSFCGTLPRLLLTVENIGAFVDIKKPDNCLLIHSPGWNLPNVLRLRARLPADLTWRHFGDLDPNGLRIGLSLTTASEAGNDAEVWVPEAAATLLDSHSLLLDRTWNVDGVPEHLRSHPAVAWLILNGRWLEQESIVLLPEFERELAWLGSQHQDRAILPSS